MKLLVRCNRVFLFGPVPGDGQKILSECDPSLLSGDGAHLFLCKRGCRGGLVMLAHGGEVL